MMSLRPCQSQYATGEALIECTHNMCFREDWAEESRAEAVHLLDVILAEDRGHIDAAYQASAHLPKDLTVHSRKSS